MSDETVVVTWEPSGRQARRLKFIPDSDVFERVEEVRTDDGWREVGSEPVETLAVERGDRW